MPTLSPTQLWQTGGRTTPSAPQVNQAIPEGWMYGPDGSLVRKPVAPTTPALSQPMQQQTATLGMAAPSAVAPTTTGAQPWWQTPEQVAAAMGTFGSAFPKAAGTDPASLNAIQVKQAQDMLAQIQANFDKQRSSTAGYLGGMNMQNSGLGMNTLALADNEQSRQQMAAANQLAATLAQANLENNRFNAQYNLDRSGQVANTALGFAQLGANQQNQQGDLALRQQQVTNQNSQFYAGQQFAADQADLDRAQQMGILAAQQTFQGGQSDLQRQHEIEVQQIAAHNQAAAAQIDHQFQLGFLSAQQQFQAQQTTQQQQFQGTQAELDRQHQTGTLGMQQAFQGQQAGLDRAQQAQLTHDQLSQQLQITLAQLANAAADRTQQGQLETQRLNLQAQQIQAAIEQNKASNQLQGRQLDNQYALGMADVNLRGQQLGMQQQSQNTQNAVAVADLVRRGLNPNSSIGQSLLGSTGMGQQQQLLPNGRPMPPQIQRQPMTLEQFAQSRGIRNINATHPGSMTPMYADIINQYQQYIQQSQPEQTFGMGVPTYGDLVSMGQLQNQTNQMQFQDQMAMAQLRGQTGGGGNVPIGAATQSSIIRNLPPVAQDVYNAVMSGTTPNNLGNHDMNYWLTNLAKQGVFGKTPQDNLDAVANFKLNMRSKAQPGTQAWTS